MKIIYQVTPPFLSMLFAGTILLSHTALAVESKPDGNNQYSSIAFIPPESDKLPIIQADEDKPDAPLPPGVVFQTAREALDADNTLLAKELGVSKESIEKALAFQNAFDQYATRLRAYYPDRIASLWVEPAPETIGRVKFVGEVPLEVAAEVEKRGQGDQIVLTGGATISEEDHYRRHDLVVDILIDLKLENLRSAYDMIRDVIVIDINVSNEASEPNKSDIIEAVRSRVKKSQLQGAAAVFEPDDIELNVTITANPIAEFRHSGGDFAFSPLHSFPICTTGWSVTGPWSFGDGLITAAHCAELYKYKNTWWPFFGITFIWDMLGASGDAAYYDLDAAVAHDDFYVSANQTRDLTSVMPTNLMMNKWVCLYGRASNVRTCNHKVISINSALLLTNIAPPNPPSVYLQHMVEVTNDTSILGDSGGGWSHWRTAFGVHSAANPAGHGFFTPIERIENWLNVTVKR